MSLIEGLQGMADTATGGLRGAVRAEMQKREWKMTETQNKQMQAYKNAMLEIQKRRLAVAELTALNGAEPKPETEANVMAMVIKKAIETGDWSIYERIKKAEKSEPTPKEPENPDIKKKRDLNYEQDILNEANKWVEDTAGQSLDETGKPVSNTKKMDNETFLKWQKHYIDQIKQGVPREQIKPPKIETKVENKTVESWLWPDKVVPETTSVDTSFFPFQEEDDVEKYRLK